MPRWGRKKKPRPILTLCPAAGFPQTGPSALYGPRTLLHGTAYQQLGINQTRVCEGKEWILVELLKLCWHMGERGRGGVRGRMNEGLGG